MKRLLPILCILGVICSCSKKNDTTPNSPVAVDTLGAGWSVVEAPFPNANDVFFIDANHGFMSSQLYGISKSSDGGLTWIGAGVSYMGGTNIAMASANRACFTRLDSVCRVTQDGGATYTLSAYHTPGVDVQFIDCFYSSLNTCYMCSDKYMWRSTDGGAHFDTVYNFHNSFLYASLFFLNDQLGWVFRSDGIYKTTDGGSSWSNQHPFAANSGYGAIEFTDQNTGFYAFSNGSAAAIYKSTDGGTSLTTLLSLPASTFYDIDFVSPSTGYVSAANTIYKTTDGGSSWTKVVQLTDTGIVEIHFADANHGWACTNNHKLLRFNQ